MFTFKIKLGVAELNYITQNIYYVSRFPKKLLTFVEVNTSNLLITKQMKKSDNTEMNSLVTSINSFISKGFTEDYKVLTGGLQGLKSGKVYSAKDVKVVDFHRFEGSSDPGDESILYAIETSDGGKGTLVDAFGASSDRKVSSFMHMVEEIQKGEHKC